MYLFVIIYKDKFGINNIIMSIPKIIHQIWIGDDKKAPTNMMRTWKEKNLDFEYIFWNEEELVKRGMQFKCNRQINMINEINGKADIIRWEILYKYGGIAIDADSICIEPFDETFTTVKEGFATYENEIERGTLVATGTMGFIPNNPLCRDIIDWIASDESEESIKSFRAWYSVGPGVLTTFLETGKYPLFTVFSSHYFLPIHFTGNKYTGHKKVYAYQEWGTAKQNYDIMNSIQLPLELLPPPSESQWVSILVSSFNTNTKYIRDCLESIRMQNGYLGIELVWMNDGSTQENSLLLENELARFQSSTRFCKVVYERIEKNIGTFECLNRGVLKCSHELIYKMDSDDVMLPNRLWTQYNFMNANPDAVVCGGGMILFDSKNNIVGNKTHPNLTWDDFKREQPDWIANHPTLCMRKSAVLEVGNYSPFFFGETMMEDYCLILHLLKRFGKIHNIPDTLIYYRIHDEQLTHKTPSNSSTCLRLRTQILGCL